MTIDYRCVTCSRVFSTGDPAYTCPSCSKNHHGESPPTGFRKGNLTVIQSDEIRGNPGTFADPHSLLPIPVTLAAAYPVGNTPLLSPTRLRRRYGLTNLLLKDDSKNPSGSLKDRASILVAQQAIDVGEDTVVLASTGNAGSAMACAGAATGIRVVLFVPESAPRAKLLQSLLYGARVVPIRGTYDDAFSLSVEYSREFGGINRNTAYNPLTVEGKKTVSAEIYNQLECRVPDLVYVPAGDGVIYSGVHKGFTDLKKAGYTGSIPRLVLVQAEGSNAIAASWRNGREMILDSPSTIADSISVGSPAAGELALQALRESGGRAVQVSDREIQTAQRELCGEAGTFVEPSSAAAWAGCVKDIDSIDPEMKVVVLLTGSGFKDIDAAGELVSVPPACEPDLQAARSYIAGTYGPGAQ